MMKRAMINTVRYTKCLNSVSFIPIRSFATEKPVNKVHHTGSSSQWLRRHTTDPFVKQSKKDGYRSRAAYKLLEIDQKYNIIKPNSTIIDVGCAPGSWCQALLIKAKKTTPPSIIGIDLLKIEPLEGVCFLQGDFTSSLIQTKLKQLLSNRPVDLITSDIAPSFSGNHNIDHLRQIELSRTVYQFSLDYLNSNGILLMKLFQGSELNSFLNKLKSSFKTITLIKPKASRSESSELYCLCRSLKTK